MKLAILFRDNPDTTFNGISTYCRELTRELRKRHQVDWFIGLTDRNTLNLGGKIDESYDLVYAASLPYGARVKLPMVAKCNSALKEEIKYYSGFKKLKGLYGQFQEVATLKKAKAVISVSQISHDILLKEYSAESVIIPDGVDLEAFKPDKLGGNPRLFWAGRLNDKRKGYDIFKHLAKDGLDWGMATGERSQPDFQTMMNQTDIFLSTGLSEGFDQTCLQAMASACTCLVSDIPAHRELINHRENGIIFGNEEEMKRWLDQLIQNSEMRTMLGRNARKKAENYPWSKTAELTERVFESVLK